MDLNKRRRRITRQDSHSRPREWSAEANSHIEAAGGSTQNNSGGSRPSLQQTNQPTAAPQEGANGSARIPSRPSTPGSHAGGRTRFPNLSAAHQRSNPPRGRRPAANPTSLLPTRAGNPVLAPGGHAPETNEDDEDGFMNFVRPVRGSRRMSWDCFMATLIVNEDERAADRQAREEARQRAEAERRYLESLPPVPPRGTLRPLRPPPPPPYNRVLRGIPPITVTSPSYDSKRLSLPVSRNLSAGPQISPSSSDTHLPRNIRRKTLPSRSSSDSHPYRWPSADAMSLSPGIGESCPSSIVPRATGNLAVAEQPVSFKHTASSNDDPRGTSESADKAICTQGNDAVTETAESLGSAAAFEPTLSLSQLELDPQYLSSASTLVERKNESLGSDDDGLPLEERIARFTGDAERRNQENIAENFSGTQRAGEIVEAMRRDSSERPALLSSDKN